MISDFISLGSVNAIKLPAINSSHWYIRPRFMKNSERLIRFHHCEHEPHQVVPKSPSSPAPNISEINDFNNALKCN